MKRLALCLREKYGLAGTLLDEDLERVLAGEGVIVDCDQDFHGRVREIYIEGAMAVRKGLPREWRRWLLVHGLAHHLLHRGNQLRMRAEEPWQVRRQERMAELFAGWFLLGHIIEGVNRLTVEGLAELAEVPLECVVGWRVLAESELVRETGA